MKYGQIAEGSVINAAIYRCFEYLPEGEVRKFVKKFAEQPHDKDQVMHTFRELVLGSFLASQGLAVVYDLPLDGKTPDWCVRDSALRGVIETLTFHVDKQRQEEIRRDIQVKGMWVGWMTPHSDRLYDRIWQKAAAYKELARRLRVPYVVAVFGSFEANLKVDEVQQCVSGVDHGLFEQYHELSGVLHFDDSNRRYSFTFIPNPAATYPWYLPSGSLEFN